MTIYLPPRDRARLTRVDRAAKVIVDLLLSRDRLPSVVVIRSTSESAVFDRFVAEVATQTIRGASFGLVAWFVAYDDNTRSFVAINRAFVEGLNNEVPVTT